MSTTIEWTQRPGTKGETWNPVVDCTKVSAGCKNCYAKTIHDNRHKAFKEGKLQNVKQYAVPFEQVQLMSERLTMPLKWKSPRTIFVNSVSDLFHESVPFSFIDQVFAVMALTPQHTYQILTKRPERMAEYLNTFGRRELIAEAAVRIRGAATSVRLSEVLAGTEPDRLRDPLPNVWLGTSVENQAAADERIPHLLRCPAAVRFLSCEPLLGAVDLQHIKRGDGYWRVLSKDGYDPNSTIGKWLPMDRGIDWVIAGGESGPKARPMHLDWARGLRDQCAAAGVPFFFKQWGEWVPCPPYHYDVLPDEQRVFWGEPAGLEGWRIGPLPRTTEDIVNDKASSVALTTMYKAGKHKSGNLLDGVEHSAWPQAAMNSSTQLVEP